MNEIQRAKVVLKILNKIYPKIKVPLQSRNVFTLLISVLLSAQCTDINVNNVTKNIYPKYYKPEHFIRLGRKKIETLIKKIGIFRIKAKSIYNLSKILVNNYEKLSLLINDFLKSNDLNLNKISEIYVNRGPGSFAGIRNLFSIVKAFHLVNKID